jgi:hypothetical protein
MEEIYTSLLIYSAEFSYHFYCHKVIHISSFADFKLEIIIKLR